MIFETSLCPDFTCLPVFIEIWICKIINVRENRAEFAKGMDEEEDDAKGKKEIGSSIVQKVWNVCEDGPERWVEVYGCATTTEEETQSLVKG